MKKGLLLSVVMLLFLFSCKKETIIDVGTYQVISFKYSTSGDEERPSELNSDELLILSFVDKQHVKLLSQPNKYLPFEDIDYTYTLDNGNMKLISEHQELNFECEYRKENGLLTLYVNTPYIEKIDLIKPKK